MAALLKNLLALGVSASIADRETFVNKLSGYILQYQDDPTVADEWANNATDLLKQFTDNVRTQHNISEGINDSNMAKDKTVEELTQAIKKLTEELQHLKGLK